MNPVLGNARISGDTLDPSRMGSADGAAHMLNTHTCT